jgi:hypothetical protein
MQDYVLTRVEKETTITYDDSSPEAKIYTCNEAMKRKLRTMAKGSLCLLVYSDQYSETYTIPKSWVKVQRPRQFTEEKREEMATAMRERMAKYREGDN